jgi:hypothetical protein
MESPHLKEGGRSNSPGSLLTAYQYSMPCSHSRERALWFRRSMG